MRKTYALFGSWGWYGDNPKPGVNLCEYKDGKYKIIKSYYKGVVVGSALQRSSKDIVYFINETRDTEDLPHEGGYVYSAKISEDGRSLKPMQRLKTYSPNPCYCVMDSKEEYLLIAHHASGQDYATKIYRDEKGKIRSRVEYDDAAVELIKIKKDGKLGEICDFDCHEPDFPGKRSFIHGIFRIPGEDKFIAVDKGLNRLYCYGINRNLDRLILLDDIAIQYNAAPKYLGFVPKTDLIYVCYELDPSCAIVKYDRETGKLTHVKDFPLQVRGEVMLGGQDFCFHPKKPICYGVFYGMTKECAAEGFDVKKLNNSWSTWARNHRGGPSMVCAYDISDPLKPKIIQQISTQSGSMRRMDLTPDHKYILSFNTSSNDISRFRIEKDGTLTFLDKQQWHSPENVTYYTR